MIFWFTGQPGHGKTTLALALLRALRGQGNEPFHIDGDELRGLTANADYSAEGRVRNVERAQAIAQFLHNQGHIAVVSVVAPFRAQREALKAAVGSDLLEIYVHSSEPRGREDRHVADYEPPLTGFLDLDTTNRPVSECLAAVLAAAPAAPSKEVKTLDKQRTIAVDFDGVLHAYSRGFQGLDNAYDPPMPGAREALEALRAQGNVLKIMSSRPRVVIEEWLARYDLAHLFDEVRNDKFAATLYIDDRALHFTDWASLPDAVASHPNYAR